MSEASPKLTAPDGGWSYWPEDYYVRICWVSHLSGSIMACTLPERCKCPNGPKQCPQHPEYMKENTCWCCGKTADNFKDEISLREFKISGLCQSCQDDIFVEDCLGCEFCVSLDGSCVHPNNSTPRALSDDMAIPGDCPLILRTSQ